MLEFHQCPAAPAGTDVLFPGNAILLYGCESALLVRGDHWFGVAPPEHLVWLPAGRGLHKVSSRAPFRAASLQGHATSIARADPAVFAACVLLGALLQRLEEISTGVSQHGDTDYLCVLLHEVGAARTLPSSVVMPRDARLQAICRRVESMMDCDIDAGAWAADFSLSTRTLQRQFVKECGVSMASWIRRRRLIEALALIGDGVAASDIAPRIGYRTLSSFCAMFKQALGEPPRRFHLRTSISLPPGRPA